MRVLVNVVELALGAVVLDLDGGEEPLELILADQRELLEAVGLAARDSLRIEAGLPLWGQELAGPLNISPPEAGFEGFVKYHKPFFVGRRPLLDKEPDRSQTIIRFRVEAQRARLPQFGDPILNEQGQQVGQVTSCSLNSDRQLQGLALQLSFCPCLHIL